MNKRVKAQNAFCYSRIGRLTSNILSTVLHDSLLGMEHVPESRPLQGQMQDESACKTLESIVRDTSDDAIVRHEVSTYS